MTDLETIERVLDRYAFNHDNPLAAKRRVEARRKAQEVIEALRREGREIADRQPATAADYSHDQFSFL